jgi:hypothetical protein
MKYDAKISTHEDRPDLDNLTVDELHGILTTYEMRVGQEKKIKGETTFEASKSRKKHEKVPNEDLLEIYDEEVYNFMKKLKKGIGKYKGKFPLI